MIFLLGIIITLSNRKLLELELSRESNVDMKFVVQLVVCHVTVHISKSIFLNFSYRYIAIVLFWKRFWSNIGHI